MRADRPARTARPELGRDDRRRPDPRRVRHAGPPRAPSEASGREAYDAAIAAQRGLPRHHAERERGEPAPRRSGKEAASAERRGAPYGREQEDRAMDVEHRQPPIPEPPQEIEGERERAQAIDGQDRDRVRMHLQGYG